ncbi:SDR family NAD(P)-dependent oxidoreductase [Microterricola pindariensis]|uniref:Short-chain dehydrogenase n=1 Tax=Microterricola pindariensis TaxID=478010 RepID=A0ABX5AXA8_9MICO|nr:SDR family NAD(P)-dependent oxidoreductase [Microterricola pindariensis]PPL19088.1 short-chain dehydrogenase [Microterricola pindariensis]
MTAVNDALASALDEIVRVSRLLGSDPALVLHGGGNTSIKARSEDVTGAQLELVLVKGSGWDLGTIEAPGFAPLRRRRLLELLQLEALSDSAMVNELRQASLSATAPTASIEALLHAHLPARVVLHSHADAIVALTDQPDGLRRAAEVLGERVVVLPYVMPGFDLARMVASTELGDADAIVLANHGLFTFADDADAALNRHRALVAAASAALGVESWGAEGARVERAGAPAQLAALRRDIARAAGRPLLVRQSASERALRFAGRDDLAGVTARGTATPEHVIRTKRVPLLGTDVAAYADDYLRYVAENRGDGEYTVLDPAPRVVLDPELGLLTVGATPAAADAVHDIYLHTMDIIDAADRDGGYASLDEAQSFEIEYWELEQARIRSAGGGRDLEGEVALVTGAASGIGRACAAALLARGASVVGLDLNEAVLSSFPGRAWRGVVGDVSDGAVLDSAIDLAAREFGGVDMLVIAAGIFPESAPLSALDDALWDRSLRVNATAVARVLRAAHPLLALSPRGGRAVLVSTKNVAAPGPGAAAYSASKTAAAQLARVAALEWAADRIRVNHVEPDAVFDTAIWTPELLAERASRYGLSVEEYRTRNLLGVEVTSATVADAVVALCAGFPATTGAHITVDGGNDRVV